MGSLSTPTEEAPPMSMQYPSQFTPFIPIYFTNPIFFSQAPYYVAPHVPSFFCSYRYIFRGTNVPYNLHVDFDVVANIESDATVCTFTNNDTNVSTNLVIDVSFDARVNTDIYGFWDTIHLYANSVSHPLHL